MQALGGEAPSQELRSIGFVRMLLTAAFLASICLIAIVIGAASAQY
jgi:hypothetical protein